MKYLLTCLILLISLGVLKAQDTTATPPAWTKKAQFGVNFTNVGLVNWAGGGQNSFSVSSVLKASAQYKKGKKTWKNSLEAGYGLVKQGETEFRKSDDRVIAISKFTRDIGDKKYAYSGILDFRTQMDNGYDYSVDDNGEEQRTLISRTFAPAYLTLSAGLEYKPNDNFYFMASPVTGKVTFVLDEALANAGAFGVDSGKTIRTELGAIITTQWEIEPMKNVNYETKLTLFQAYREGAFVDVMWDNLLTFKVNEYISSTFSTQLIYDEDVDIVQDNGDVGPAVQFKHVFTIGFLASF